MGQYQESASGHRACIQCCLNVGTLDKCLTLTGLYTRLYLADIDRCPLPPTCPTLTNRPHSTIKLKVTKPCAPRHASCAFSEEVAPPRCQLINSGRTSGMDYLIRFQRDWNIYLRCRGNAQVFLRGWGSKISMQSAECMVATALGHAMHV